MFLKSFFLYLNINNQSKIKINKTYIIVRADWYIIYISSKTISFNDQMKKKIINKNGGCSKKKLKITTAVTKCRKYSILTLGWTVFPKKYAYILGPGFAVSVMKDPSYFFQIFRILFRVLVFNLIFF